MSQPYTIGLLSGTSADAIDGILVKWVADKPQLVCTHSLDIPEKTRTMVFDLAVTGQNEIEKIRHLDYEFAQLFSQTALSLCKQAEIKTSEILAIGSHGQTIRHYPPSDSTTEAQGFSLQIGDPNIIANNTGITTVADFRRRDIAAGGHGAPLAPSLHKVLFQSQSINRIILNTGGIANITYLPTEGVTIGFDTGPANGLMDSWCLLHKNEPYDKDGDWAASGNIQSAVVEKLLSHPYFSLPYPKSTGREDFNLPWLQEQLSQLKGHFEPADIQASLLALSVESIAAAIEGITGNKAYEIYICGGGAHNRTFCDRLEQRLKPQLLASTQALGLDEDWVEATCFAWMAKQTMAGKTSNLPSVTGADKEVVLGGIYPA